MTGKKNIVFGFVFLLLTASLGPYMVETILPEIGNAAATKQQVVGKLQLMDSNDFEDDLEPMTAEDIAKANTRGILGINTYLNQLGVIGDIKGGPHAHGNLEALLNIVVGIVLGFLSVGAMFKQLISWTFILGTLLHSGVLYLAVVFQISWAGQVLATGIGPILLLLGLIMMAIASAIGFNSKTD